jgi:hypothetical protein
MVSRLARPGKHLMLSRIVRNTGLILFILIFGMWAKFHFTTVRIEKDSTSQSDLAAAKAKAEILLPALERYRGETGLYPISLDQLNGKYISSPVRGFRYSARANDWVYKSDGCAEREKSLHGWIMKRTDEYNKEVAEFMSDCLSGYRYYQLQSRNFPRDGKNLDVDRWAYYDSSNRQWSLGWCSHGSGRGHQETSENGVCHWQDRADSIP